MAAQLALADAVVGNWTMTPWDERGRKKANKGAPVLVLRRDGSLVLKGSDAFLAHADSAPAGGRQAKSLVGRYRIDASHKPAWMDFAFADGRIPGLVERMEGDRIRLELFLASGDGPRPKHPTKFSDVSPDQPSGIAFVLERKAPAAVADGVVTRQPVPERRPQEKDPTVGERPQAGKAPTIPEAALWDLYYVGAAGVKDCCGGDSDGCWRMSNARGGLGDWCARGSRLACKLADMIQAESISCR